MTAAAEPGSETATAMKALTSEIAADRKALLEIMAALGIPVRGYKVFAAWAGEKAGRLKLNGRLLTRSPLSSLEETEMLRLGAEGKAAGWRTLRVLAGRGTRLGAGGWTSCWHERAASQPRWKLSGPQSPTVCSPTARAESPAPKADATA